MGKPRCRQGLIHGKGKGVSPSNMFPPLPAPRGCSYITVCILYYTLYKRTNLVMKVVKSWKRQDLYIMRVLIRYIG